MDFLNEQEQLHAIKERHEQHVGPLTKLYEMGAFYSDTPKQELYGFFETGARATLHEGNGPKRIFLGQGELLEFFYVLRNKCYRIKYGASLYNVHTDAFKHLHLFKLKTTPKREPGMFYRPIWNCKASDGNQRRFEISRNEVLFLVKEVIFFGWGCYGCIPVSLRYEMLYGEQRVYIDPEGLKPFHENQA